MKVLFATCAAWLLHQVGARLVFWAADIEDWAGIGPEEIKWGGSD